MIDGEGRRGGRHSGTLWFLMGGRAHFLIFAQHFLLGHTFSICKPGKVVPDCTTVHCTMYIPVFSYTKSNYLQIKSLENKLVFVFPDFALSRIQNSYAAVSVLVQWTAYSDTPMLHDAGSGGKRPQFPFHVQSRMKKYVNFRKKIIFWAYSSSLVIFLFELNLNSKAF